MAALESQECSSRGKSVSLARGVFAWAPAHAEDAGGAGSGAGWGRFRCSTGNGLSQLGKARLAALPALSIALLTRHSGEHRGVCGAPCLPLPSGEQLFPHQHHPALSKFQPLMAHRGHPLQEHLRARCQS